MHTILMYVLAACRTLVYSTIQGKHPNMPFFKLTLIYYIKVSLLWTLPVFLLYTPQKYHTTLQYGNHVHESASHAPILHHLSLKSLQNLQFTSTFTAPCVLEVYPPQNSQELDKVVLHV